MKVRLREAVAGDRGVLEARFVEAVLWHPDTPRQSLADLLLVPGIRPYFVDWGQPGDRAWIAEVEGLPVGAAWYRFFAAEQPGYGFVDPTIPELGVAVHPDWRGRSLGTKLLQVLLDTARAQGCPGLSLSVDPRNPARRLYERLGFRKVGEAGTSWTLLRRFAP